MLMRAERRFAEWVATALSGTVALWLSLPFESLRSGCFGTALEIASESQWAGFWLAATIGHALGVYINGRWKYSPAIRLLALALHWIVVSVFLLAIVASNPTSFYIPMFGFLLVGLTAGTMVAAYDLAEAADGRAPPHR